MAVQQDSDLGAQIQSSPETRGPEAGRLDAGPSVWRRMLPAVVCLVLYVVLAGLDFGGLRSLGSATMNSDRSADQIVQIWWLSWAHAALAHGHGLFFTNWSNFPVGYNFGLNGSIYALGIPMAPITAAFGPIVSWDVLGRLAPIVSAFAMCLVLRRWTRWWPAAFVGGLLYGFSSYMLHNASGYLFLAFVGLPPVIFLLADEMVHRQRWHPVVTGVLLAVVCGVQYLISSEILATTLLFAALAAVVYLVRERKQFAAKRHYLGVSAVSTAAASLVTLAYPVGFTFLGTQHAHGPPNAPDRLELLHGDLLGLFVPGPVQRFSISSFDTYAANHFANGFAMYLGIPLLLAIGLTVYWLRSRGIVLLTGALAALALVLSLGTVLYVGGVDTHVPLPFVVLANLPVLEGINAARLCLFTILFGAAIIAFGVDELYRRLREARSWKGLSARSMRVLAAAVPLVLVGLVALPTLPGTAQVNRPTGEAAVFRSTALATVPAGSVLLGYPYPNPPYGPVGPHHHTVHTLAPTNELLLDQAVSGMRFKLIGGFGWRPTTGSYGSAYPSTLKPESVETLFQVGFFGAATPAQAKILQSADLTSDIRTFVARYHVDTVVVLPIGANPGLVVDHLTSALGPPEHIDGASVWLHLQHRASG